MNSFLLKNRWTILIAFLALFLRSFQLTSSPPSPYWEEVALGYDAYTISETGKDHHGNSWPLVAFESFGDWKPSGYFYAVVPFIKLMGLNLWAVRLPSVVAGVAIVIGLGVLTRILAVKALKEKQISCLSMVAMLLATVNPWLIQFSRAGWEVNLATALILWGVIAGWRAIGLEAKQRARFIWLAVSALLLILAMYTYHSARILAPVLGLWFAWQFIVKELKNRTKKVFWQGYLLVGLLTLVLVQPFITAWESPVLGQRVAETSILQKVSIVERSNQLKDMHDNSWWARLAYHRYLIGGGEVLQNFLSHFRLDFLFLDGDVNPRHSSQYFGLFYPVELVFLVVGVVWLLKNLPAKQKQLLALWLVFGVLPAALTKAAPHALRILPTASVWLVAIAVGVWQVWEWLSRVWNKKLAKLVLVLIYLGLFIVFYRHLLVVYPQRYSAEWQFGYQGMIAAVEELRATNPDLPVYITREHGRPAMYYWFYTATDPRLVQEANSAAVKDQGEFLQFENLYFVRSLGEIERTPAIIVGSPAEMENFLLTDQLITITNLNGEPVWQLGLVD